MNEVDIVLLSSDSESSNLEILRTQSHHTDELSDRPKIPDEVKRRQNKVVHTLSDSDDSNNDLNEGESPQAKFLSYKHLLSDFDDSDEGSNALSECDALKNIRSKDTIINTLKDLGQNSENESQASQPTKRKGGRKNTIKETNTKENRSQKKEEEARKKAERKAALNLQKQLKPGECMKHMKVVMDSELVNCNFGGELLASIQSMECEYELSSAVISYSVTWLRHLPDSNPVEERQMLLIWQWEQFVQSVRERSLCDDIQNIKRKTCGKIITLVVYSLDGYFSYLKNKRRRSQTKKRKDNQGDDVRIVSRGEIELALTELQIQQNCSHRLINTGQDLGQLVCQFTKSISEIPFKREKQKREQDKLEWFALGDSRDCVRIDKEGNGLLRLWQQQLCQFNLAGIDTAQAIAAVYSSPQALIQAYDKCDSQKEGELLLQNIPVRRCQGPLASARRIGPELSKKIFMFFNNVDGDAPLSQE